MIVLSVGLKLIQEAKADSAAAKLKAMISVTRDGAARRRAAEIPVAQLVPGDVVQLAAGDMIPGDVRIVQAKDLFVIQGSLTGESLPGREVRRRERTRRRPRRSSSTSIAFLGTSVESGSATAVVVATGQDDLPRRHGRGHRSEPPPPTAFDRGISRFTWLMLRFMLVMVPLVFVINGLTKGNWTQAFFFALAVAVGLTPEMLPMIVTVCLSKGAVAMGKKKVIVKRLNAIQNLGAMDVLCTDKTGTLTLDQVDPRAPLRRAAARGRRGARARVHEQPLPDRPEERPRPRGARARGDARPRAHPRATRRSTRSRSTSSAASCRSSCARRRARTASSPRARPRRSSRSARASSSTAQLLPMDHEHIEDLKQEYERLSADGFRVLAIATKEVPAHGAIAAARRPTARPTSAT